MIADMPPHSLLTMYEAFLTNFQQVGVECGHMLPEKLISAIQQQRDLIVALTAPLAAIEAATGHGVTVPSRQN
jgi:hypothetical protein